MGSKPHRVDADYDTDIGAAWVFCAMDVNSRLVIAFYVGKRDEKNTEAFITDLRARLVVMPQIMTSDGWAAYASAVRSNFTRAAASTSYVERNNPPALPRLLEEDGEPSRRPAGPRPPGGSSHGYT